MSMKGEYCCTHGVHFWVSCPMCSEQLINAYWEAMEVCDLNDPRKPMAYPRGSGQPLFDVTVDWSKVKVVPEHVVKILQS